MTVRTFEGLIEKVQHKMDVVEKNYNKYMETQSQYSPKQIARLKYNYGLYKDDYEEKMELYPKYWATFNDELAKGQRHMCRINSNLDNLVDFFDHIVNVGDIRGLRSCYPKCIGVVRDLNSGVYHIAPIFNQISRKPLILEDMKSILKACISFPHEVVFMMATNNYTIVGAFLSALFADKAVFSPYNKPDDGRLVNSKEANFYELTEEDLNLLNIETFPEFIREKCIDVKEREIPPLLVGLI